MTAREEAREAALADEARKMNVQSRNMLIRVADAASDVWEPIVRAFVEAKAGENEHGVFWQTSKLRAAYQLAEEALR